MKKFNYVSLFSGIGGFDHALNAIGGNCVMASEIDKYATISYEAMFGHKPMGDVTKITAEDVPDHDVLVGGFPCQAFSVAGKRLGFEDTRGTLFFEIARIAKVKQPKVMLMENVKGLVSHDKGRTLDTIIQTLDEIGYTVDFEVMNSKYFGVPQNRERIFIVAVRNDLVEPQSWDVGRRTDVVAKGKKRIAALGVRTFNFDWPEQTEVAVRLRDILETDVDESFYLSDEKTATLIAKLQQPVDGIPVREATKQGYAVANEGDAVNFQFPDSQTCRGRVGRQIAQMLEASNINQGVVEVEPRIIQQNQQRKLFVKDEVGTLHASMTNNQAPKVMEPQIEYVGVIDDEKVRTNGKPKYLDVYGVLDSHGLTPALTTMTGGGREPKVAEIQTPALLHNIYGGFREDRPRVFEDVAPTIRTSAGGGHLPSVLEEATPEQYSSGDGISYCIDANYVKGASPGKTGKGVRTHVIEIKPKYRIRKLTPRECFRLQAFTDEQFDKCVAAGISNTQLYKQAGNAVTVNVIKAIGERLVKYL